MFQFRTISVRVCIMLIVMLTQFALIMMFDVGLRFTRKIDAAPETFVTFIKTNRNRPRIDLKLHNGFEDIPHTIVVPDITLDIATEPSSIPATPG